MFPPKNSFQNAGWPIMTANLPCDRRRVERGPDGRASMDRARRALGADRAAAARASAALALPGAQAPAGAPGAVRHPLRAAQRQRLAASAARAGLRLGHHLLATPRRVAVGRRLGRAARPAAGAPASRRRDRLLAGSRRRQSRAGQQAGAQTGPSPVDRGRPGSGHHLLVEVGGIPLACLLSGGKRNDVTQLLPLADARCRRGAAAWVTPSGSPAACSPTAATTTTATGGGCGPVASRP